MTIRGNKITADAFSLNVTSGVCNGDPASLSARGTRRMRSKYAYQRISGYRKPDVSSA